MALEPCYECGKDVSTSAESCPACGAPCAPKKSWTGYGLNWKTKTRIFRIPILHVAIGLDSRGRPLIAKGIIAIGPFALGLITIAQFGVGILFGLGQFVLGLTVLGQFAFGLLIGIGQIGTGVIAVGQFVYGIYGLGQAGIAKYMWSASQVDMEAVALFYTIYEKITGLFAS